MNRFIYGVAALFTLGVVWTLFDQPEAEKLPREIALGETVSEKKVMPPVPVVEQKKKVPKTAAEVPVQHNEVGVGQVGKPAVKLAATENVLYTGTDRSKRYGIQVIDPAMPIELSGKKATIHGEIDGEKFMLKIPENAMYDPLQLRIADRRTRVVKTVELGTGDSIVNGGDGSASVQVDFNEPEQFAVSYNNDNNIVFP